MRIFQLQNTRVRNHTLLSNPIKSCWMGSSDLAVKKVPQKIHTAFPSFSLAIRSTSSSFLYCSASCNCTPFSLVLVLVCCFSLWANSLYIPQPCFFHSADCQPSESNCGKTHSSSQPSSSFPLNVKASLWLQSSSNIQAQRKGFVYERMHTDTHEGGNWVDESTAVHTNPHIYTDEIETQTQREKSGDLNLQLNLWLGRCQHFRIVITRNTSLKIHTHTS